MSTRPYHRSCASSWLAPSSGDRAQIFVATARLVPPAVERRRERALGGAVHRRGVERAARRARAQRRRRRRASRSSPSNVRYVPRPTTGPSRRSSITAGLYARAVRRRTRPRRTTGRRPGRGPCARAAGRRRPPPSRRRPRRRSPAARPRGRPATRPRSLSRARPEHRARVVRQPTMALPRIALRHPRRDDRAAAERGRRIAASTAARPPWPSACRCRRCPARSRTPPRRARRSRAQSERRRGRDAVDVTVEARRDRHRRLEQPDRLQRAHRVRERDGQRAAAELDVGDPPPAADARRTPARAGCAASSRRPAGRRAGSSCGRPPRRAGAPPARACTAAPSRARLAPAPSPRPRVRFA